MISRRQAVVRTTVVLVVTAGGLAALDKFLAKTESGEMQRAASANYAMGTRLLAEGKATAAVEPLRQAWVLARDNAGYELALGNALAATGKTAEAEMRITAALSREPNDGEANLAAARLRVREKGAGEADSFYHRAIFGHWGADGAAQRVAARLELIELLARQNRRGEMLGELISLEEEAGEDRAVRKKLARYFLQAGSPARAANVYRQLVEKDRLDGESYAGLGEAELESGRYREARSAFIRAAMHSPEMPIRAQLELVDMLTEVDPTPRQLTSAEKYRRSSRILEWVRGDLRQQADARPEKSSAEIEDLLQRADAALTGKTPAAVSNEAAEGLLSLAEQLWRARVQAFGEAVPADQEAFRRILEKLAA